MRPEDRRERFPFKAFLVSKKACLGLLMALLLCLPPLVGNYWTQVLGDIGIYVILGVGLNVVVGFAGLLDLGYVAFYAIGAYGYALLASPHFGLHVPFWLMLPACVALAEPVHCWASPFFACAGTIWPS